MARSRGRQTALASCARSGLCSHSRLLDRLSLAVCRAVGCPPPTGGCSSMRHLLASSSAPCRLPSATSFA
eukprot:scaffold65309_cov32-Tisochrysis_lutea.AAC.5